MPNKKAPKKSSSFTRNSSSGKSSSAKKPYCGSKPVLPKNSREGTYTECYRKGQVRMWGKKVAK